MSAPQDAKPHTLSSRRRGSSAYSFHHASPLAHRSYLMPVAAKGKQDERRSIESPYKVMRHSSDNLLNAMIYRDQARKPHAHIATEEKNHPPLDLPSISGREKAHPQNSASDNERAGNERAVHRNNREHRPRKRAKQAQHRGKAYHAKRDVQNHGKRVIGFIPPRMAENEQRLSCHKKANSKQLLMQNFKAEICTQSHGKTRLQKRPIPQAKAFFTYRKNDKRHDGRYSALRDVLKAAPFHKATLDGTTAEKSNPIQH